MLNTYTNQQFIGCDKSFEEGNVILFGVPFDGTTSYRPGTRFAPTAIRPDSYGLETYSPYLDLDLEDFSISDIGDVDLPFGNPSKALLAIKKTVETIVEANKKPLMIGGEHLVTLPAIEVLAQRYPNLHIIHLDAHTDLRDEYLGEELSHATVLRRAWDIVGDDRIYQFGIRSGMKQEFDWAKTHTYLHPFDTATFKETLQTIKDKPIYFTLDLDILDPSIFPGTGTPEPGGITMKELLDVFIALKDAYLIGADVVELAPHYDASGVSTAVACKAIREIALLLAHH